MRMPNTIHASVRTETAEAASGPASSLPDSCHLYFVSTETGGQEAHAGRPPCCPAYQEQQMSSRVKTTQERSGVNFVRINWQIKAVLPIAVVLLNGLLLFMLATISWRDPERHIVLVVAGAGAVIICAVLLFVLAFLIQRPMVELQEKMSRVGEGDLN